MFHVVRADSIEGQRPLEHDTMSATVFQFVAKHRLSKLGVVFCILLGPASAGPAEQPSVESFRRSGLLNQFDHNKDGTLSELEKTALR